MAISFNNKENINSTAIKDNEGFTFALQDNTEGFGFICFTESGNMVVTITAVCDDGIIDQFSILINDYDEINSCSSIKELLKEYFDYDTIFIKEYKHLEDMNIIVDF